MTNIDGTYIREDCPNDDPLCAPDHPGRQHYRIRCEGQDCVREGFALVPPNDARQAFESAGWKIEPDLIRCPGCAGVAGWQPHRPAGWTPPLTPADLVSEA